MDLTKPISAGIINYPNIFGTMKKNRESIISAEEKMLRNADHQDVKEALLKWFSIQ